MSIDKDLDQLLAYARSDVYSLPDEINVLAKGATNAEERARVAGREARAGFAAVDSAMQSTVEEIKQAALTDSDYPDGETIIREERELSGGSGW